MPEPLVRVRGLRKQFGDHVVLDGVDLTLAAGEVLGLMGPNGGGKSTLLLHIAGLVRPSAGEVLVRGTPAHRVALHAQGTVGLITATPGLYPLLTGWENLVFFGRLYGLSPDDTRARVHDLAQALDLADALHARTATFSSGMQQKVSLLRALLMDPPVLLLDEPTANLDPLSAHVIHATARAQADAGKGVIWVTHDLAAAERLCDRVALVAGRIAALQTFDSPRAVPPAGWLLDTWRDALGAT